MEKLVMKRNDYDGTILMKGLQEYMGDDEREVYAK